MSAQQAGGVVISLEGSQIDFPVDLVKGSDEGVVIGWPLMPSMGSNNYTVSSGIVDAKVYAMPISSLFSHNYCYIPNHLLYKHFDVLIARRHFSGAFELWVDENGNKDFSDEKSQELKPGKPLFRRVSLLLDSIGTRISLPLQFNVRKPGKTAIVKVTNLLKYHFEYALSDTLLQLNLLVNFFNANFKLKVPARSHTKTEEDVYLLDEPFPFDGKYFILRNLDILNKTVELHSLPPTTVPHGYKKGYYADVDSIKEQVKKSIHLTDCKVECSNKEFLLLHFWAYWAQPCIDQYGELAQLEKELNESGKAVMINFPALRSWNAPNEEILVLKERVFSFALPCVQLIDFGERDNCGVMYNQKSSVWSMFNVNTYPTYILLDKKGKIIYRGDNRHHELHALLKDLNLLR